MNRKLLLHTLRSMGADGGTAADLIEAQTAEIALAQQKIQRLNGELDRSEQRVLDMDRQIERLKKELIAAKVFA